MKRLVLSAFLAAFVIMLTGCALGTKTLNDMSENDKSTEMVIRLSNVSDNAVLHIDTKGGSAFGQPYGSGKDFSIRGYRPDDYGSYAIPVKSGTKKLSLTIDITNDDVNELDEQAVLNLSCKNMKLAFGQAGKITFTIKDNDCKVVRNFVKDYAASTDGVTDDTAKMQQAVDDICKAGGGVLFIPAGKYSIKSVEVKQGVTIQGETGTVILRPANQGKWCRTFYCNYTGQKDSKPIVIKDMTIDGNSQEQGTYKGYELEQAHLIFFCGSESGGTTNKGRVRGAAENLELKNCVGDGVSVYTNADVGVYNVTATDVFRGGLVITGGNSDVRASCVTTSAAKMGDPGGIDVEVDGVGYAGSMAVNVRVCRFRAVDGDFDVVLPKGGTGVFKDCYCGKPSADFGGEQAKELTFNNCEFHMGIYDNMGDQYFSPYNITFNDCDFYAAMLITSDDVMISSYMNYVSPGGKISWSPGMTDEDKKGKQIAFNRCRFFVDKDSIQEGFETCAIFNASGSVDAGCAIILNDCEISKDYDYGLMSNSAIIFKIHNLKNNAKVPEQINAGCAVTRS